MAAGARSEGRAGVGQTGGATYATEYAAGQKDDERTSGPMDHRRPSPRK